MGRRSRKPRAGAAPAASTRAPARPATPPRPSRGEARNAAVRAQLRPYAADERPVALRVAVAVAALLGVGNLIAFAAGMEVSGQQPNAFGVVLISALMLIAAAGMWRKRYWAVLGFEALVGVTVVWAALSLLVAGNLAAVVVCLAIIGLGGWLFWKLVRVMSRIQVPRPGGGHGPGIR